MSGIGRDWNREREREREIDRERERGIYWDGESGVIHKSADVIVNFSDKTSAIKNSCYVYIVLWFNISVLLRCLFPYDLSNQEENTYIF